MLLPLTYNIFRFLKISDYYKYDYYYAYFRFRFTCKFPRIRYFRQRRVLKSERVGIVEFMFEQHFLWAGFLSHLTILLAQQEYIVKALLKNC